MQNCPTKHLPLWEAATGCRTRENFVSSSSLASLVSITLFGVLIETLALVETLGWQPAFVWCNVTLPDNSVSHCADARGVSSWLWKW